MLSCLFRNLTWKLTGKQNLFSCVCFIISFFFTYNDFNFFHYTWFTVFCQFSAVQQGAGNPFQQGGCSLFSCSPRLSGAVRGPEKIKSAAIRDASTWPVSYLQGAQRWQACHSQPSFVPARPRPWPTPFGKCRSLRQRSLPGMKSQGATHGGWGAEVLDIGRVNPCLWTNLLF